MNAETLLATADSCLLAPYDLEPRGLERVFATLARRRVEHADLYFQYTRAEGWSLEEGIVKAGSFSIEQGVGVRAISGDKTAFAYSDDISARALEDAARATRAIAAAGQSRSVRAKGTGGRHTPPCSDPLPAPRSARLAAFGGQSGDAREARATVPRGRPACGAGDGAPRW
jgi:TldD protein